MFTVTETQTNPKPVNRNSSGASGRWRLGTFAGSVAGSIAGQAIGNALFRPQHYVPPAYQPGTSVLGALAGMVVPITRRLIATRAVTMLHQRQLETDRICAPRVGSERLPRLVNQQYALRHYQHWQPRYRGRATALVRCDSLADPIPVSDARPLVVSASSRSRGLVSVVGGARGKRQKESKTLPFHPDQRALLAGVDLPYESASSLPSFEAPGSGMLGQTLAEASALWPPIRQFLHQAVKTVRGQGLRTI